MDNQEKIKILHDRIYNSFYEEENYLLCDKLVKKLLEIDYTDVFAIEFQQRLKGIDLNYVKKDWEDSQDLHGYKEQNFIQSLTRIFSFSDNTLEFWKIWKIFKD